MLPVVDVDGVREGKATDETLMTVIMEKQKAATASRGGGLIVLSCLSKLTCYFVISSRQLSNTLNHFSSQGGIAEWLVL
jgi:hypothetical protein